MEISSIAETRASISMSLIPDDIANIIITHLAGNDEIARAVHILDDKEGGVEYWVIEIRPPSAFKALSCVNSHFSALTRPILKATADRAYTTKEFGEEHLVFVEVK